jgi:DNA-nicking Smr family endonuclease
MRKNIWNLSRHEMKKRPDKPMVNEDDIRLFRESLANVVPLNEPGRVVHSHQQRKPIPLQRLRDERAALADSLSDYIPWDIGITETGEELVFLRNGISRQIIRKLRRGYWVIQDELDLHGSTSADARVLLVEFLNYCLKNNMRCVRIIHGKGLRSKNREPVLKSKVANWLMQRDEVLAFCQARPADGGSGAVVVLLKTGLRKRG